MRTDSIHHFPTFSEIDPLGPTHSCIYFLPAGRRCGQKRLAKADKESAARLQDQILRSGVGNADIEQLKEFARLCCCKQAHRTKLEDFNILEPLIASWKNEHIEITGRTLSKRLTASVEVASIHSPDRPASPRAWNSSNFTTHRYNLRSTSLSQSPSAAEAGITSDDGRSGFRPHIVKPSATVASALRKALSKTDQKSGHLYIFTRDASPGFVKIGYTTKNVPKRIAQWEKQCGFKLQLLASFENVPHIYRTECLVHFELAEYWRTEIFCKKCCQQHREWFEIDANRAIKVARKWCRWMQTAEPYENGALQRTWVEYVECLMTRNHAVTAEDLVHHLADTQRRRSVSEVSVCGRDTTTDVTAPSFAKSPILETTQPAEDTASYHRQNRAKENEALTKRLAQMILQLTETQQEDLTLELVRRTSALSSLPRVSESHVSMMGGLVRRETASSVAAQA